MQSTRYKQQHRALRQNRIRARVSGVADRPRLAVFRSGKHIYAQLIDDTTGHTVATSSSLSLAAKGKKTELSSMVGKEIAEQAKKVGVSTVVFDRGGYRYHGRVKALAEAAREAGLEF